MGKYLEQQYEERDQALELAKKHNLLPEDNSNLTWEELKEEAKKMFGYRTPEKMYCETDRPSIKLVIDSPYIYYIFTKDGMVFFYYEYEKCVVLAKHRTPDQMLAIMKALQ